jgi:hypothetical protein
VGNGTTNSFFDLLWPAAHSQYQVLQSTIGSSNIVANPGFENGTGSNATGWTTSGSQPPVRVSTDANSGTFSMQLFVTNTTSTPGTSEIDQNVGAAGGSPVIAGQAYTFSFRAKKISSGVSYVQNYGITWLNGSGGTVGSVGLTGFSAGNGAWLPTTVPNLIAPPGAVNASLKIYGATGAVQSGSGGVLIDDVALSLPAPSQTNVVAAAVQPGVQIAWPGAGGRFYDVQSAGNLGSGAWSNLVSAVPGNGSTNTITDLITTNQFRFYRVVERP